MLPAGRTIIRNRLLATLPASELDRLLPDLHPVSWSVQQTVYEVGAPIEQVYFIEEGLASIIVIMSDGSTSEVGMTGFEGMIGAAVLLGVNASAQHVVVQIPGTALWMSTAHCKATFERLPVFHARTLRFVGALLNLRAQTAACNRLHAARQRCARWLLMASDRVQSDMLPMTHEFLAAILGVRRTGVTAIARDLQRAKLIQYRYGQIVITDRRGLEAAACECYRVDYEEFRELLYVRGE
jgi:CRP-like cAMP-binding protein